MRKRKTFGVVAASWVVLGAGAYAGDVQDVFARADASQTGSPRCDAVPGNHGLPQGSEKLSLDAANFSTTIDNPWWPMRPDTKWVFRETNPAGNVQRVVITVTDHTKRIANGIDARVVRDVVTENGTPVEVTSDWYAQDSAGNIWYLGEDTAEYANGSVASRAGSFEAGVHGAQAGIALPADPVAGLCYRQEYLAGEAEDKGSIVSVGEEQVDGPAGYFTDVLMTRDTVPLEPKVEELKFYARGVGPVLTQHVDDSGGRAELISFTSDDD